MLHVTSCAHCVIMQTKSPGAACEIRSEKAKRTDAESFSHDKLRSQQSAFPRDALRHLHLHAHYHPDWKEHAGFVCQGQLVLRGTLSLSVRRCGAFVTSVPGDCAAICKAGLSASLLMHI